jgi:hypothetical protein
MPVEGVPADAFPAGVGYELNPDGLQFSAPVMVTLRFSRTEMADIVPVDSTSPDPDAEARSAVVPIGLLLKDSNGTTEPLPLATLEAATDSEEWAVSAELTHFSELTGTAQALTLRATADRNNGTPMDYYSVLESTVGRTLIHYVLLEHPDHAGTVRTAPDFIVDRYTITKTPDPVAEMAGFSTWSTQRIGGEKREWSASYYFSCMEEGTATWQIRLEGHWAPVSVDQPLGVPWPLGESSVVLIHGGEITCGQAVPVEKIGLAPSSTPSPHKPIGAAVANGLQAVITNEKQLIAGESTVVEMGYWLFGVTSLPTGEMVITGGNDDENGYARFTSFGAGLDVLWNIEVPLNYMQFASVRAAPDGSLLAVGNGWSDSKLVVANLAPDGSLTGWAHLTLGSSAGLRVGVPLDYGFLVVGDVGYHEIFLSLFNADLSTRWSKKLPGFSWVGDVAPTEDGGFAVVGSVVLGEYRGSYDSNYDLLAMKVSAAGDIVWQTTLGGADSEEGTSVAVTASGDIAVAGSAGRPIGATEGGDAVLALLSRDTGTVQWMRTYGTSEAEDWAAAVIPRVDGSLALVASFDGRSTTAPAALVITTDASGITPGCTDPSIGATPPPSGNGALASAPGSLTLQDFPATLTAVDIPEASSVAFAPNMTETQRTNYCAAPPP